MANMVCVVSCQCCPSTRTCCVCQGLCYWDLIGLQCLEVKGLSSCISVEFGWREPNLPIIVVVPQTCKVNVCATQWNISNPPVQVFSGCIILIWRHSGLFFAFLKLVTKWWSKLDHRGPEHLFWKKYKTHEGESNIYIFPKPQWSILSHDLLWKSH